MTIQIRKLKDRRLHRVDRGRLSVGASLARSTRIVIGLLVTGKFGLAGTIASVKVLTKIALYYFHERAWAIIPWGR